ncbi:MAG: hypothetical protein QGI60_03785 [archaeon]|jgi:hypothetical protein|nr:hypothetical protein [archaeon]
MTKKIKRGFLNKRYYCGKCNAHVEKDDEVCHSCGAMLDVFPDAPKATKQKILIGRPKRARAKRVKPEPVEEELSEEFDEGLEEELEEEGPVEALEYEEDLGEPANEQAVQPNPVFLHPNIKTALWIVVIFVHLWGLFSGNEMVLISGVLLLVIIELEFIRRKMKKR